MSSEEDDVPATSAAAASPIGGILSRDYFAMVEELRQAHRRLESAKARAAEDSATIARLSVFLERAREGLATRDVIPTTHTEEIRARVACFVADLDALLRRAALESAAHALGHAAAAELSVEKRSPRSPDDLATVAGAIEAHLRAHPDEGIEAIARALGVPSKSLTRAIASLLRAGSISKKGRRRGTKYFVTPPAEATASAATPLLGAGGG